MSISSLEVFIDIEFQLQKARQGSKAGKQGREAWLEIATARQRGTCVIPTEFLHSTGFPLLYIFA